MHHLSIFIIFCRLQVQSRYLAIKLVLLIIPRITYFSFSIFTFTMPAKLKTLPQTIKICYFQDENTFFCSTEILYLRSKLKPPLLLSNLSKVLALHVNFISMSPENIRNPLVF